MDMNKLRALAGITAQPAKKVAGTPVAVNFNPPIGLLESGTKDKILEWVKSSHPSFQDASATLNHYLNSRTGKGLSPDRRGVVESARNSLADVYHTSVALAPFDSSLLRRMAGLPSLAVESHDDDEPMPEPEDKEKPADSAEDRGEAHDELIKTIAKSVEGKSFDEVKELLGKVYDAGFHDGKADTEAPEDEAPEEEEEGGDITEAAMTDEAASKAIFNKIKGTPDLTIPKVEALVKRYLSMVGRAPTDTKILLAGVVTLLQDADML